MMDHIQIFVQENWLLKLTARKYLSVLQHLHFFTDGELADYPRFWCSGGSVSFDDDWNEEVIGYCDWEMSSPIEKDYPPEIWKILPNILEVMNENVTGGCCGGCV